MDWQLDRSFPSSHGTVRWASWGHGDPLVFVHGWPFSSYVWRDIAAAFAGERTVYVWDLLGFGQSDKPDGDVSLGAQGQVFAELLEHWGLDAPDVVGHDFGGATSLRAHLLHGATYRRLALLDAVAVAPWGSEFFHLVCENTAAFDRLPANMHAALVYEYVRSGSARGLHPETTRRLVEPWLDAVGQHAFYRQIAQARQSYTEEIEPRYPEIDLPVLVGWGGADCWLPVDQGERLVAQIPSARLEVLPSAGHLVQEDAPALLTATLGRFFS